MWNNWEEKFFCTHVFFLCMHIFLFCSPAFHGDHQSMATHSISWSLRHNGGVASFSHQNEVHCQELEVEKGGDLQSWTLLEGFSRQSVKTYKPRHVMYGTYYLLEFFVSWVCCGIYRLSTYSIHQKKYLIFHTALHVYIFSNFINYSSIYSN